MLARVNRIINKKKVNVTRLDIDDKGSVIALEDLELNLPSTDDLIFEILKSSSYASIFTNKSNTTINEDEDNSTILIANAMTADELAQEQRKTVDAVKRR
jgi:hypothetical protein